MRRFVTLISLAFLCTLADACTSGHTTGVTNVTTTSATLSAVGTCDATATHPSCAYYFEYGVGNLATHTPTETVGAGSHTVEANVTGLNPNTTYAWNACAETSAGSGRFICTGPDGTSGSTSSFTTSSSSVNPAAARPNSTATYPASYYSGPLGNNEVLPVTKGHTLLSCICGGDGVSSSQARALISQRESDMGRHYDLIGFECFTEPVADGNCSLDNSSSDLGINWIHSQGAIPYVQWDPGTRDAASVAAGNYDSNINAAANYFKAFGYRVMIRMWWEFANNGAGSWSPSDFVAGWKHVVNLFRQDGATNVGWIWCANDVGGTNNSTYTDIANSYPGDSYVDWVCSDQYNWDTPGAYVNGANDWLDSSQLFNYSGSIENEYGGEKPYFVGETGSKYDTTNVPSGHTSDPNRKKNWFINYEQTAATLATNENGAGMIGISFFDSDVNADPADHVPSDDWRVDSNCESYGNGGANCAIPHVTSDPNTYSGFLSMADSAQFSGGVAGGNS